MDDGDNDDDMDEEEDDYDNNNNNFKVPPSSKQLKEAAGKSKRVKEAKRKRDSRSAKKAQGGQEYEEFLEAESENRSSSRAKQSHAQKGLVKERDSSARITARTLLEDDKVAAERSSDSRARNIARREADEKDPDERTIRNAAQTDYRQTLRGIAAALLAAEAKRKKRLEKPAHASMQGKWDLKKPCRYENRDKKTKSNA